MKKLMLFFLAIMPLMFFTGCSDDDANEPEDTSILGSWYAQEGREEVTFIFYVDGKVSSHAMDSEGNEQDIEGTYAVSGNELTIRWRRVREKDAGESEWDEWENGDETKHATYSISGEQLRITSYDSDSGSQTFVAKRIYIDHND